MIFGVCLEGGTRWGLVSVAEFSGNSLVSLVAHELLQLLLTPLKSVQKLWTLEDVKGGPHSKLLKSYSTVFFSLFVLRSRVGNAE